MTCLFLCPPLLQAVAIVFGFLILLCLIIIMVFAILTRKKMIAYGKENIVWRKEKTVEDPNSPQDVEDWVNGFFSHPFLFIYLIKKNNSFVSLYLVLGVWESVMHMRPFRRQLSVCSAHPRNCFGMR